MATRFKQRRQARRQRTKQTRAKERTKRRKTWRENITRRVEGRQAIRMERVKQKGASGYYTPEATGQRMDFAKDLIGTASSLIPGMPAIQRRDEVMEVLGINGVPAQNPSFGGGGGGYLEPQEEEKPVWQNPMVIGGVVIGGIVLFKMMNKKK